MNIAHDMIIFKELLTNVLFNFIDFKAQRYCVLETINSIIKQWHENESESEKLDLVSTCRLSFEFIIKLIQLYFHPYESLFAEV